MSYSLEFTIPALPQMTNDLSEEVIPLDAISKWHFEGLVSHT